MASINSAPKFRVYQLKITLLEVKPPIWRRLLVKDNITLSTLAEILETTMGWTGLHLHEFEIGDISFGVPDEDFPDSDLRDDSKIKLKQISDTKGFKFIFEYDFGDSWRHKVEIEEILGDEVGKKYPVCLDGERACPPEDCGGPSGYDDLVKAMKGKKSKEREEFVEWLGGEFDPEKFDLGEINEALRQL